MKALAYMRVSGKGQVDGDGYERQKAAINNFSQHHDITIYGDYFEAGVSGATEALVRPEFSRMLRDIDEGSRTPHGIRIDAIVVERMDRLARDLMVSEFLLAECRKRNLKVFCADQGQLIDMASNDVDPTRILIRQIMAALAQWEKAMLVAKLAVARERKRASGERCEGIKPYGSLDGEATIARLIVNLRNSGMSFGYVATMLNSGGMQSRSGKPWTRGTVFNIYNQFKDQYERQSEQEHDGGLAGDEGRTDAESLEEMLAAVNHFSKTTNPV